MGSAASETKPFRFSGANFSISAPLCLRLGVGWRHSLESGRLEVYIQTTRRRRVSAGFDPGGIQPDVVSRWKGAFYLGADKSDGCVCDGRTPSRSCGRRALFEAPVRGGFRVIGLSHKYLSPDGRGFSSCTRPVEE